MTDWIENIVVFLLVVLGTIFMSGVVIICLAIITSPFWGIFVLIYMLARLFI